MKVGGAVETTAGKLAARWVIHAAAMGQDLIATSRSIAEATENSLLLADKLGATSIAFPALGTGVGGFSVAGCARLMLEAVQRLFPNLKNVRKIFLVLFDPGGYKAFEEELRRMQ